MMLLPNKSHKRLRRNRGRMIYPKLKIPEIMATAIRAKTRIKRRSH